MVLVAVGYNNTPDLFGVLFDIGEIGNNQVDTRHILIGKRKTAVDDEHIVAVFIERHILSDFVYTAEESYLHFFVVHFRL